MAHGLIEALKDEHRRILAVLEEVDGIGAATPEGLRRLLDARALFLDHLRREDRELYPLLAAAARKDARLRLLLEGLAKDLLQVSALVDRFFLENAAGARRGAAKSAGDFGRLAAALGTRIRREESFLYPAFERAGLPGKPG